MSDFIGASGDDTAVGTSGDDGKADLIIDLTGSSLALSGIVL